MTNKRKREIAEVLVALVVVLAAGFIIGYGVAPQQEAKVPEITVPAAGTKLVLDADNEYGESNVEKASDPISEEDLSVHEDLRDETPPGVDQTDVHEINTDTPQGLGKPLPVGGAQTYSCPKNLVRNFSNRATGTKVGIFVLHYTVSRPGTLNVIRGLFDRPSFGASSHLGLEPSGRCEQWVDWGKKAWTQGAFNSVSDSVEIVCCNTVQSRSWWLAQPIFKNEILASIVADRLRARGIPARKVDPVGCDVQRAGWTDHNALECGNTHHDVSPNFPYDILQTQIAKHYNSGQAVLPGPRPKPAWFWDACDEWLGGQFTGLSGPSPKPTWFWQACGAWAEAH